ncbi:MAG: hypothetical protein GKR99_03240 [Rhodobacteraceae bacterium]|nr:hypothetical protein [Paracoccaceae bacterium]
MTERQQHPGRVEDYTMPFLVSVFVLIFIALFAIWAWAGLVWVLFCGWLAGRGLSRAEQRMAVRAGL